MDAYLAKKGKPTIEQRKIRATPKGEAPQINKLLAALNKAFWLLNPIYLLKIINHIYIINQF